MKNRAVEDEGVELTVFAAGIRVRRQIEEERFVQIAAGERGIEDLGIDTDGDGAKSIGVEFADEIARVALPDGEEGGHADAREVLFAIGAEVFEENVAESDFLNTVFEVKTKSFFHARFVNGIDALWRNADFVKRQADGLSLPLEKLAADAVHADAVVTFGDGSKEGGDANVAPLKKRVQSHGAVFATAPAEENWFRADH